MVNIETSVEYNRVIVSIDRVLGKLNEVIWWGKDCATFGYIGNLDARFGDDRCWYVFLPHPGRVGTEDDRLGGFSTGDIDGARRTLNELSGALTMTRYIKRALWIHGNES